MGKSFRAPDCIALLTLAGLVLPTAASPQTPLGTAFTYQGRLTDAGAPATGSFDLQFKLHDASSAGAQVGSTVTLEDVAVSSGLFTVGLDFGASAFGGNKRWLEIGVRPGTSTGAFTSLAARQELTPVPHAVTAANALTVAGLTCASDQVLKWNGSGWTCGTDSTTAGGGTLTSVATGSGLTGGPITTAGTIAIASGGVTSSMLANGAVTTAAIANGAVGSAQIDAAQVQARIGGTCPAGSSVQTIAADGSVTCAADSLPLSGFAISTLDGPDSVGQNTSMAIGPDGLALISYYDITNQDLKVAHCANLACTSATTATLDSTGKVGRHTSIAIGADGLGLIGYFDETNLNLKVAHCSNAACSSATISTLDSTGDVGRYPSVTIGTDGLGLISYAEESTWDSLKVAHCSNVTCSGATIAVVDAAHAGESSSIAIGTDGLPLIAYRESSSGGLRAAHCSNAACTAATTANLDIAPGVASYADISLAIGADGRGLISYWDSVSLDLRTAHCSNLACSSATLATLDSAGNVGANASLAIGADGLGVISYHDFLNGDLKVAHCSDTACSSAGLVTVESAGTVGAHTSIRIGADALPLVAYYSQTNADLKVAHCANAQCLPFVNRRPVPSTVASWTSLTGTPAGFADNIDDNSGGTVTSVVAGAGLSGGTITTTGTISVDTAQVQARVSGSCSAGNTIQSINADGTVVCAAATGNDWKLGGNSGTTAGSDFIGTTDSQPLEFKVNGARALRLEPASFCANFVGGNTDNSVTTGTYCAFIGGGDTNKVTDNLGVVGGGAGNRAGDDAGATDDHTAATVGGGVSNTASGEVSTVSGGGGNLASGAGATIAGGTSNRGKGGHSTVPGGYGNHAGGDFSFAAGERAKVRDSLTVGDSDGDQGTFSWADAQATDFVSTGPNQFLVRASGGVWFGTDSTISFPAGSFLATSTGGYLSTGGTWTNSSDRALKENFQRVDAEALLDKLVGLPISEWNYKKEGRSARHVGPTAQDFRAVFGLGADDKSISTIDPAGIALAAIQELHRRTQMLTEKTREIDELRLRLEQLEAALAERGSR